MESEDFSWMMSPTTRIRVEIECCDCNGSGEKTWSPATSSYREKACEKCDGSGWRRGHLTMSAFTAMLVTDVVERLPSKIFEIIRKAKDIVVSDVMNS